MDKDDDDPQEDEEDNNNDKVNEIKESEKKIKHKLKKRKKMNF